MKMIHVEISVTKRRRLRILKYFKAKGGRAQNEDGAFMQGNGCNSKLLKILKMR